MCIYIHVYIYTCVYIYIYIRVYIYITLCIWRFLKMGDPQNHGFQSQMISFAWFGTPLVGNIHIHVCIDIYHKFHMLIRVLKSQAEVKPRYKSSVLLVPDVGCWHPGSIYCIHLYPSVSIYIPNVWLSYRLAKDLPAEQNLNGCLQSRYLDNWESEVYMFFQTNLKRNKFSAATNEQKWLPIWVSWTDWKCSFRAIQSSQLSPDGNCSASKCDEGWFWSDRSSKKKWKSPGKRSVQEL